MWKELLKNVTLLITAIVLVCLISVFGFPYGFIKTWRKNGFKSAVKYVSDVVFLMAFDIDRTGNFLNGDLLTDTMSGKGGYKFGHIDETVSSAIGKNQRDRTITKFGFLLMAILHLLDTDHSLKSINSGVDNGQKQ